MNTYAERMDLPKGFSTDEQLDRMVGKDSSPMQGIVVAYVAGEQRSLITARDTIGVADSDWKPLALPLRLGMDMLYVYTSTIRARGIANFPFMSLLGEQPNKLMKALTVDCNPESERFGRSTGKFKEGVILVFRDPGQRMGNTPLDALEEYIKGCMKAIKAALASQGLEAAKAVYNEMGPRNMKIKFKEYRAQKAIKHQGMGWETVRCPVKIEGISCEGCATKLTDRSNNGEGGLMRCGRCRNVLYCDKECQKMDWKAHKPFCVKKQVEEGGAVAGGKD